MSWPSTSGTHQSKHIPTLLAERGPRWGPKGVRPSYCPLARRGLSRQSTSSRAARVKSRLDRARCHGGNDAQGRSGRRCAHTRQPRRSQCSEGPVGGRRECPFPRAPGPFAPPGLVACGHTHRGLRPTAKSFRPAGARCVWPHPPWAHAHGQILSPRRGSSCGTAPHRGLRPTAKSFRAVGARCVWPHPPWAQAHGSILSRRWGFATAPPLGGPWPVGRGRRDRLASPQRGRLIGSHRRKPVDCTTPITTSPRMGATDR